MKEGRDYPPPRTIPWEAATEFERDERTGATWPVNDGRDIPGYEYETMYILGGQAVRFAVREARE